MADFDIDKLLEPVSDDSPCGEDLEYDPLFGELERAAQGKEGHQMGDEEIPPEPPDWNEVRELAIPLFEKTKDLRVALHLARAGLNRSGLPGFADGLNLVDRMIREFWDNVFPQLDEEDDNDPTFRMNSLLPLNSRQAFVGDLGRATLVSSQMLGQFSMRDIRLANGEISLPEGDDTPIPDPAHINSAFLECDMEELAGNSEAADQCVATLAEIESYISEQVGAAYAPDLGNLNAELKAVQGVLRSHLGRRGVEVEVEGESGGEAVASAAAPGEIRSRDDAVLILDRVSEYFRRNEPSSPVPLLLQRAKRLIAKDFMEILRDVAPDGMSQAELIRGLDRED